MRQSYLDAIKTFEGFSAQSHADYKQLSVGYGTRARFAGEVIDHAEAERRFMAEMAEAESSVRRFAPALDDGTCAALTSLTFNAGAGWMKAGLGQAVKSGDLAAAREIFKQYVHAGGHELPGLVARRSHEAAWFSNDGAQQSAETATNAATGDIAVVPHDAAGSVPGAIASPSWSSFSDYALALALLHASLANHTLVSRRKIIG